MTAIREMPLPLFPHAPRASTPPGASPSSQERRNPEERSAFARLVHGFAKEADRGEATVRSVLDASRGGPKLEPGELLALQAGIYRYGETMDLAARLVDKASSAAKTVVQGQ
jgi:hypothetical protein